MDGVPDIETVYVAVQTLYHSPTDKEKASQWLADLQSSVYAWKISDQLLREKRNLESCYIAAQTMRTKIQFSFQELPADAHISLRDSLMEHLDQINEHTNNIIVTQLSLAIATLALQMSQWENPVMDLMSRYNERSPAMLLEILEVLPEEIHARPLRLGENRRKQVIGQLKQNAPTVAQLLQLCLGKCGDNVTIHMRVLKCFASWIGIGAIDVKDAPELVSHVFTVLANAQLQSGQIHEAATECVCILLQAVELHPQRNVLCQQMYAGVLSLEDSYHMSVAHENTDRSVNYCRIFTELAETFLDDLLRSRLHDQPHYAVKAFDLVLTCVGHHDYEVAEITFNLWCRLSEELYKKNKEALTLEFKPYVERLLTSLCRHSRIEPDHEGLLEDGDEFLDFRLKVSELIKDVVFIVGSSNCFRQMYLDLQAPGVSWDASEAALFVMQSVAKNILPNESEVVPKVVEAILNLPPSTHIAVRHTSILLLGELCEWIDLHPESLEPVLQLMLLGLQQPQLASAAATALTSICVACRTSMVPHLPGLIQVVQALDKLSVKHEAANSLLRGVIAIVSKAPSNEVVDSLRDICKIQLTPLIQLTESEHAVEKGKRTDPSLYLDRLAVIIRHLDLPADNSRLHPCATILDEIWPALTAVSERYQNNGHVMERWCRCLRFAVRTLGRQSEHFLLPISRQIVSMYARHRHSSCLYLGSILVDECAKVPQCGEQLLDMLAEFLQPTFQVLQETNGLKNHPDTVEDFFRLNTRFLQRLAPPFLQCAAMPSILECALMSCSLDHRDANAAVMSFFHDLITCKVKSEANSSDEQKALVSHVVQQLGKRLVNNLIQASVFSLQSYMLSGVAEVLWDLLEHDRVRVSDWLREALSALPTHNSGGVMTATQKQLETFFESVNCARTLKEVCHLLRDLARLYR